jgi:hypothetical protein
MYPKISVIETSALQEFSQGYGANETQKRPGKSDIEIEIFIGNQPQQTTETDYHYAQYINRHSPIGSARAATYPIKAQETAHK